MSSPRLATSSFFMHPSLGPCCRARSNDSNSLPTLTVRNEDQILHCIAQGDLPALGQRMVRVRVRGRKRVKEPTNGDISHDHSERKHHAELGQQRAASPTARFSRSRCKTLARPTARAQGFPT